MKESPQEIVTEEMATEKKANMYLIFSLLIFIIVVGITIWLHFTNAKISGKINEVNSNITQHAEKINELKQSNEVAAYDIIMSSKNDVIKTIERSKADIYLKEFMNISKKYNMLFSGFNFDWEKVNTNASYVSKDNNKDAISWVSDFIKAFRDWENKIFILDPVTSVAWDAMKRTFSVWLKVIKK